MGNITSDSQLPAFTWKKVKYSMRKKQKWKTLANLINEKRINDEFEVITDRAIKANDEQRPNSLVQEKSCEFDSQYETFLNVPIVLTCSTLLYQRNYKKKHLPLGTILKAVYKCKEWLYVETVYGEKGYIKDDICLPLAGSSLFPKASADFIGAHMTRFITTGLNGKTSLDETINYSERNVDILYLQATGIQYRMENLRSKQPEKVEKFDGDILLVVKNDYISNGKHTLSVRRGEIVHLIHDKIKGWFWIRNEKNDEGFIPAAITTRTFK